MAGVPSGYDSLTDQAVTTDPRILVVDDDHDTCATLADILTDFGYAVDVAHRGGDALELVRQNTYRLALLDFLMPCMTGVELYERIRQQRSDVHAFLITAFASSETRQAAQTAGMRQVFEKPIAMPALLPMVAQIMEEAT